MRRGIIQNREEMRRNGLLAGLCAGLGFSLALWLNQAFSFWRVSTEYPLPLTLTGVILSLVIGGLAGWLAARLDHAFYGVMIWLAVGVFEGWLAIRLNYYLINQFTEMLHPELAGLTIFPFDVYARLFQGVVLAIVGILSALAGIFQIFLVESAANAGSTLGRLTALGLNIVIFAAVGLAADYIIQRPLREPVMAVSSTIQLADQNREKPVSLTTSREMHLRALKPLGEKIFQPYQLFMGAYDPNSIMSGSVHLRLQDSWATCHVFEGSLNFCELSEKAYLQKLGCWLDGNPDYSCRVKILEESKAGLEMARAALKEERVLTITEQRGDAVLIDVSDQAGSSYRCVLRLKGDLVLESCKPAEE